MVWSSEYGTFIHTCPVCTSEFFGRKNKVYCSAGCKARHNNDLAAVRRTSEKSLTASIVRNERILRRMIQEGELGIGITDEEELLRRGFDPNAPAQRVSINGESWFVCGQYAYQHNDEEVEIMDTRVNQ